MSLVHSVFALVLPASLIHFPPHPNHLGRSTTVNSREYKIKSLVTPEITYKHLLALVLADIYIRCLVSVNSRSYHENSSLL